jgi:LMBR1 domain-containing protein 1
MAPSPPAGFSPLLLAVTVIVAVMLAVGALYVLISYQHPDDANQAWFPKLVVLLAMWLSCAAVLLFPLDVANRAACGFLLDDGSACRATLPMRELWHAAFFTLLGLAFVVCPFTLFYYEGDSD